MVSTPKVFLSFAREDTPWVNQFSRWLQLGDAVEVENYMVGDNLEFGRLSEWVDKRLNEATAVIAFMSEYYREKKWAQVELNRTLNEARRRRLIFVPIMLHPSAKGWWTE